MLDLQRRAGNRAVVALLNREPKAAAPGVIARSWGAGSGAALAAGLSSSGTTSMGAPTGGNPQPAALSQQTKATISGLLPNLMKHLVGSGGHDDFALQASGWTPRVIDNEVTVYRNGTQTKTCIKGLVANQARWTGNLRAAIEDCAQNNGGTLPWNTTGTGSDGQRTWRIVFGNQFVSTAYPI